MYNIEIINNEEYGPVVSSRTVAEELEKQHQHVKRDLEKILISPNVDALIIPSQYKDTRGRTQKEYLLTKDGFTLYMFNIQGYNDFKMAYINEFNQMENQYKQQKPLTPLEQIQLLAQGTSELNERIETVESEITDIKKNSKLEQGEYSAITRAVNEKVAQHRYALGLDKSNKQANTELFRDINNEIKRVANVATRSQIRQKDFSNVMELIRLWQPSQSTVFLIKK